MHPPLPDNYIILTSQPLFLECRNLHLVDVVKGHLDQYIKCGNNKTQKSVVLNMVATELSNNLDPPARFVRLEPKNQRWYEIEGFCAREKISQTFRDIAQGGYRSANTFKNLKRRKSSAGGQLENVETSPKEEKGNETTKGLGENRVNCGHESDKKLPNKASVSTATTDDNSQTNPGSAHDNTDDDEAFLKLPKKEQLERQIEELKRQLALLDDNEGKQNQEQREEENGCASSSIEGSGDEETKLALDHDDGTKDGVRVGGISEGEGTNEKIHNGECRPGQQKVVAL